MRSVWHGCLVLVLATAILAQQRNAPTIPREPLGPGPFTFDTAEQHKIRVAVITKGLSHPWGLTFLPDGNMLVTERAGRLRLIRDRVLDPKPISGIPEVFAKQRSGLMDVALHPKFAENKLVYFAYTKPRAIRSQRRWDEAATRTVRLLVYAISSLRIPSTTAELPPPASCSQKMGRCT